MKSFPYQYIPVFNFFLGMGIWIVDAWIDSHILTEELARNTHHGEDKSFIDSLLFAEGTELWMRILIVIVLVSVGFYAKSIIHQHTLTEKELLKHKHNLEELVKERILEINEKNIALKAEIQNRKQAEKELEQLATTDSLTKLYNRRKAQQLLDNEIERAKRYKNPLSIIILDIDHFKSINDKYGHNKGDEVLANFSSMLLSSIRSTDIVARWGGEEFLIVCISASAKNASLLAENLRKRSEQDKSDGLPQVTFSAGVVQFNNDKNQVNLISRADKALYIAKKAGRNRVETAS